MRIAERIETWVFDLDNTLYSPTCRLFDQVDRRMGEFISARLSIDRQEARRIQKDYFVHYGTTLKGLMRHHAIAPDEFLEFVHDIDVTVVPPDDALRDALAGLAGRRLVYTNGSRSHAERILARLGVSELIDGIFDIAAAGYVPKPDAGNFRSFLDRHRIAPERAVMIEDMARNLIPASAAGMTTVWLRTGYEWADVHHRPEAVDIEIDDLAAWLKLQHHNAGQRGGAPGRGGKNGG
ncbi:MAG: pyrimidine 5'-nucleotidase [Alphaproteobacteria bacterium]|nr:MAG: pyrimidine 5'-nucleotidase [Alphaproteobacteria bacterium]